LLDWCDHLNATIHNLKKLSDKSCTMLLIQLVVFVTKLCACWLFLALSMVKFPKNHINEVFPLLPSVGKYVKQVVMNCQSIDSCFSNNCQSSKSWQNKTYVWHQFCPECIVCKYEYKNSFFCMIQMDNPKHMCKSKS
jgi:hypothetical protein